jgi:hypothetical protein
MPFAAASLLSPIDHLQQSQPAALGEGADEEGHDEVLASKIACTARSSCRPAGVPTFMTYSRFEPIDFLQTPQQGTMIFAGDSQVRRAYLDMPIRRIQSRPDTASRSATMRATRLSSTPSG